MREQIVPLSFRQILREKVLFLNERQFLLFEHLIPLEPYLNSVQHVYVLNERTLVYNKNKCELLRLIEFYERSVLEKTLGLSRTFQL